MGIITDPIADMLTRIRNAGMAKKSSMLVPISIMKLALVRVLKSEGFIRDFEVLKGQPRQLLRVHLLYSPDSKHRIQGLRRVSRPGLRRYVGKDKIPQVYGGLGVAVVSTSQGLMTGSDARRRGVGGELLCYVW
jgi:small subunit ribosomal protein S8